MWSFGINLLLKTLSNDLICYFEYIWFSTKFKGSFQHASMTWLGALKQPLEHAEVDDSLSKNPNLLNSCLNTIFKSL